MRYNVLQNGSQPVAIVTVKMEGLWQFAEPEFPPGHVRGKVFGDLKAMLPVFALPGAALAPNKPEIVKVTTYQEVSANQGVPVYQEGWLPGQCSAGLLVSSF